MPRELRHIRREDLQTLHCLRQTAASTTVLPSWRISHRTRTSSKGRYCGEITTSTRISDRCTSSYSYSYWFSLFCGATEKILVGLSSKVAGHRPGHHLTLPAAGNFPGRGYSPAGWPDSLLSLHARGGISFPRRQPVNLAIHTELKKNRTNCGTFAGKATHSQHYTYPS